MNLHQSVSTFSDTDYKPSRTQQSFVKWGLALVYMAFFLVVILVTGDVNAQTSADWTKPATGIIDTLKSGLVTIGALVVGLAVIGYGIWQALQPEPNFKRLGMIIFGGVCIMAGPQAVAAILQAAQ